MSKAPCVMEGSLDEYDLVSVVQTVGAARHGANLELYDEGGVLVGSIQLEAGQILSASCDGLRGLDAMRRLLKAPRARQFFVYRNPHADSSERVGPVTLVLAQLLTQTLPPAPESQPVLLQGSLAEVNLRDVAAAVSLGRICVGVEVFESDGRRVGALYLRGSKVLFSAWGRVQGHEALHELLKPRRDGRFVMFRSADARLGEPIADLTEFLRPKLKAEPGARSLPPPPPVPHVPQDDFGDIEGDVTLVVPPPSARRPRAQPFDEGGPRTGTHFEDAGPRTGTRSVARKSFRPPAEVARPQSEHPPAPRFRHSEVPSAGPDAGSILLSELGYGPRAGGPGADAKIIAVTSARGGAGRTTLALNLALALARRDQRVLLVDADTNGLLPALHAPQRVYAGVAELLAGEAELDSALLETRAPGLSLLPSGDLGERAYDHPGWSSLLGTLAARFDLVLVDCAPGLYGATPAVLRAASHQLMVSAAEPGALRACESFQARLERALTQGPRLLGLVLNQLDYQVRASVHALEELSDSPFAAALFDAAIPRSPAFMEASARGIPVAHTQAKSPMAVAWVFETLAAGLLERLQLEQPQLEQDPLLR